MNFFIRFILIHLFLEGCGNSQSLPRTATAADLVDVTGEKIVTGVNAAGDDTQVKAATERVQNLKAKVAPLKAKFEGLQMQMGQLNQDLMGDNKLGCWGLAKLNNLQMTLYGEKLGEVVRDESAEKGATIGNPSRFFYSFGDEVALNAYDESATPMMKLEGSQIEKKDFNNNTIGEMTYFRINKGMTEKDIAYRNESFEYCKLGPFQCSTWYRRFETTRYRIDRVQLKVNGSLFYENNLGVTFDSENSTWLDPDISKNKAYIDFKKNPCPAN